MLVVGVSKERIFCWRFKQPFVGIAMRDGEGHVELMRSIIPSPLKGKLCCLSGIVVRRDGFDKKEDEENCCHLGFSIEIFCSAALGVGRVFGCLHVSYYPSHVPSSTSFVQDGPSEVQIAVGLIDTRQASKSVIAQMLMSILEIS